LKKGHSESEGGVGPRNVDGFEMKKKNGMRCSSWMLVLMTVPKGRGGRREMGSERLLQLPVVQRKASINTTGDRKDLYLVPSGA